MPSSFECKVSVNESVLQSVLSRCDGDRPLSLVGSVDQGTSSSRFLLVDSDGSLLSTAQVEFNQIFPDSSPHSASCVGWHEHDPFDIYDSVATCVARTVEELARLGLDLSNGSGRADLVRTVGITNQRETTVAWNARTGRVYYNAIVWDDTRTAATAEAIIRENSTEGLEVEGIDLLRAKTGLPIASYFAGTKVRWLIDNVPELRRDLNSDAERKHVRFGTVDVWLLYMLTGYRRTIAQEETNERLAHEGGVYKTEVSNASRWLMMDLESLSWDEECVRAVISGSSCWDDSAHDTIPMTCLPEIEASVCRLGNIHGIACCGDSLALKGVVVGSILGDQQAALFGQSCFKAGEAKCTYGTGLFLLMVTGGVPVPSKKGLLTTVAFQLRDEAGQKLPPVYALEGSVAFSGSTIGWLRDRIELIESASETEALALSVPSNDNMYLVPAFSGLFCPHWKSSARGCIVGLTATHSKAHIVRAALEASAFQAKEVFDAMISDSQVNLLEMRVDGGATANKVRYCLDPPPAILMPASL